MAVIQEPYLRQEYRGLNSAESDLLRRYLRRQDSPVDRLETQVRLGPGERLPDSRPDSLRRSWQESSKLKLDVLVTRRESVEVIELKEHLRTSHIGQLLSYRYWLSIQRDFGVPMELVAVAPDLNPSTVQPTRQAGIELVPLDPSGERHLRQGESAQPPF